MATTFIRSSIADVAESKTTIDKLPITKKVSPGRKYRNTTYNNKNLNRLALNQSIFLIYLPFTEVCVENYKNPMVTKTDRNENVFKIPPKRSFSARGHINVG
jgi:hypothetical protein